MNRNIFALIFFFSSIFNCIAQKTSIVPVTPEAASLSKTINYPVSYNTGIPNISLPLYKIEVGGLTIPVELNYHAGGFKITERTSSLGLGWSSSMDLQITRTVNGIDDFKIGGYISNAKMKSYNTTCISCGSYPFEDHSSAGSDFPSANSYGLAAGEQDGMPDKFSYKLLNKSGSFFFRKSDNGTSYSIVTVPFENIKITYSNGIFTLVDTDGTIYTFGAGDGPYHESQIVDKAIEMSQGVITTWKCKTIKNASQTETISFSYKRKDEMLSRRKSEYFEYFNNSTPCNVPQYKKVENLGNFSSYESLIAQNRFYNLSSPKFFANYPFGNSMFYLPYLNSQNEAVYKTYTKSDLDANNITYGISLSRIDFSTGSITITGNEKIESISIKDSQAKEIKTFSFGQSYTMTSNVDFAKYANGLYFLGTLYLDSIEVKKGGTPYETYRMVYPNKVCLGSHLYGMDSWGYPNDRTTTWSNNSYPSLPQQTVTQTVYKGNNLPCVENAFIKNVNFNFGSPIKDTEKPSERVTTDGMLRRIIYPTGGYVDFDFESNMYRYQLGGTSLEFIGMSGGLRIRSINYFDGKSPIPVSQKFYKYGELEDGMGLIVNNPYKNFNPENRSTDVYSYNQTIGYITGPPSSNIGADFEPVPTNCYNRSCMNVRFTESKTTYQPSSAITDYTFSTGAPIYYTKVTEYNSDHGVKTGKTVYKYYDPYYFDYTTKNQTKIPETNIDYIKTYSFMGELRSVQKFNMRDGKFHMTTSKEYTFEKYIQASQVRVAYSFFKTLYEIIGGSFNQNTRELYNTKYSFQSGTDSFYSLFAVGEYGIPIGKLLLKSEIDKIIENGDTLTTTTNYTYSNQDYPQISKKDVLTKDGKISQTYKYAYDYPSNSVYITMTQKNMISQVIELSEYEDDIKTHTKLKNYAVFGSGSLILPSSIQTCRVPFISFENEITYDAYDNKGNILQTTGNNGLITSYIWGYQNQYPIIKLEAIKYGNIIPLLNIPQLNMSFDDSVIKNAAKKLRDTLPNAFVYNFTYSPLIGITSETAPNSKLTNYQYDQFGRLTHIIDHNNNIIKQVKYNLLTEFNNLAMYVVPYNSPRLLSNNTWDPVNNYNIVVNQYLEGATQQGYSVNVANGLIEQPAIEHYGTEGMQTNGTKPANVQLKLSFGANLDFEPKPANVYLDLLQNGHVVFSKKFNTNQEHSNVMVNIEEGTYTISYRMDKNYPGSLTKIYLSNSVGFYEPVKTGTIVSFDKNIQYQFLLTNHRTFN